MDAHRNPIEELTNQHGRKKIGDSAETKETGLSVLQRQQEQRSKRLRKRRERDCARCAQTANERQATSQQRSTREHKRMIAEERGRSLEWVSTNQHERLAVETPEERELRLECYSARYMEQQSVQPQLPLFHQCSIQAKLSFV